MGNRQEPKRLEKRPGVKTTFYYAIQRVENAENTILCVAHLFLVK